MREVSDVVVGYRFDSSPTNESISKVLALINVEQRSCNERFTPYFGIWISRCNKFC